MKKKTPLKAFEWILILGTVTVPLLMAVLSRNFTDLTSFDWWLTYVAAVLNICCCVCSARGSIWTFLFGAIYNSLYAFYCIKTQHFGNGAVYALFFLPMQLFGYLRWRRIGTLGDSDQVAAKKLSARGRVLLFLGIAAMSAGLVFALRAFGGKDIMVDAVCTAFCVVAQILLTLAYFEQWFIWMGVNISTIVMWTVSALGSDSGVSLSDLNLVICYVFVLFTSINGLLVWYRLSSARK